jgi:hypothetical protein
MASGGAEFRLNTTEKDARWMRGGVLQETLVLPSAQVRAAVESSMQVGLSALRNNLSAIRVRTGRLQRSPAVLTRKYGRDPKYRIVGLLGYKSGVAPHARYIELGTPPRDGRGKVTAQRPAWLAFFHNRERMAQMLQMELERMAADALSKVR